MARSLIQRRQEAERARVDAYEASLQLEKLGRAGEFAPVPDGLARLRTALDELRPELQALASESL